MFVSLSEVIPTNRQITLYCRLMPKSKELAANIARWYTYNEYNKKFWEEFGLFVG
jgi:hypothetical protein